MAMMRAGLLVLEIHYKDTVIEKEKKKILPLCNSFDIRALLNIFFETAESFKSPYFPTKIFPISLVVE